MQSPWMHTRTILTECALSHTIKRRFIHRFFIRTHFLARWNQRKEATLSKLRLFVILRVVALVGCSPPPTPPPPTIAVVPSSTITLTPSKTFTVTPSHTYTPSHT